MLTQSAENERKQFSFDFLPDLPIVVQPHHGQLSSDAGLLPLRQFDQRWNFTGRMVQCLDDPSSDREHSLLSMLRQRVFGILAGYEDCKTVPELSEARRSGVQTRRRTIAAGQAAGEPADAQPV